MTGAAFVLLVALQAAAPVADSSAAAPGTVPDEPVGAEAEAVESPTDLYLGIALLGGLLATQIEGFDELDEAFGEQRVGRGNLGRTTPRFMGRFEVTLGIAGGVLLAGQITDDPAMGRAGVRSLEALAISSVITSALKFAVGRGRPDFASEADEFRPFQTSSRSWSYPSGHASAAFALATALSLELGPEHGWVPFVAYPLAGWVGVSRVLDHRHWPTDVLAGAVVGVLAGRLSHRWFGGSDAVQPRLSPVSFMDPGGNMLVGIRVAVR